MNQHSNPFVRGYQHLSVHRLMAITYEDGCPRTFLPLHPSQSELRDDQVQLRSCVFSDDFALIEEGHAIPCDLEVQCRRSGVVHGVVYAVHADESGMPLHVGDTYSDEAAREMVRRLTFQTGHYSRSWEISAGHLHEAAIRYLEALAVASTPTGLLFEAFRLPDNYGVGVKLIATPWTDRHLMSVDGRDTVELRRQHRRSGVPDALVHVLHLAARADVRFVVFDPDAQILEGLPLYGD